MKFSIQNIKLVALGSACLVFLLWALFYTPSSHMNHERLKSGSLLSSLRFAVQYVLTQPDGIRQFERLKTTKNDDESTLVLVHILAANKVGLKRDDGFFDGWGRPIKTKIEPIYSKQGYNGDRIIIWSTGPNGTSSSDSGDSLLVASVPLFPTVAAHD